MATGLRKTVVRFTVHALRGRLSICECVSIPYGFEYWMWDLIVLVPDYCLSCYFEMNMEK